MGKLYYYPSCKFIAKFPETSKRITSYFSANYDVRDCCRADLKSLTSDDIVIYLCNSCAAFFEESSNSDKVVSVWEVIAADKNFAYPNHEGKLLTIQDCWRTYDNPAQQNAVREILSAMNIKVVEQNDSREKTTFCGKSLYEALPDGYEILAPNRLVKEAQGLFIPHSEDERDALMKEHCETIYTDEVVCYCLACLNGVNSGGKSGVHLAELVFG